jgi:photosystem II stability/assembly factor-like uncharacterized protein
MRCQGSLACQAWRQGNSAKMLTQGFTSLMIFVFLPSMLSCTHMGNSADRRNTTYRAQLRSFSLSGQQQASVILDNTRDLKLTTDRGQTWQVIRSATVGDSFECATMIDSNRGWAVNNQGHVFTTDSGGASWTRISELKDFTCASQIEFLNEKDGWIRECLSIWRTRDGGVTWRETLSTVTPGVLGQPTGMFPIDANTVVSSASGGQVYLTRDGGETWKLEKPLAGTIDFNDVWFVDQNHGWLAGYEILVGGESERPILLETTDGGAAWKEVLVDSAMRPSSICFVGEKGWLAGSRRIVDGNSVKLFGVLLFTEDAGRHWNPVRFGPEEPPFSNVRFTDKANGWLVGRDNLYRTDDGGKTWNVVLSLPPNQSNG